MIFFLNGVYRLIFYCVSCECFAMLMASESGRLTLRPMFFSIKSFIHSFIYSFIRPISLGAYRECPFNAADALRPLVLNQPRDCCIRLYVS